MFLLELHEKEWFFPSVTALMPISIQANCCC